MKEIYGRIPFPAAGKMLPFSEYVGKLLNLVQLIELAESHSVGLIS